MTLLYVWIAAAAAVFLAKDASALMCRACMGDPATTKKNCPSVDCGPLKSCGISYIPEADAGTMVFTGCIANDPAPPKSCDVFSEMETGAFCACHTDNCNDPDNDACKCLKNYKPQTPIGKKKKRKNKS